MLRSAPESDAQMQQLMQWLSDRELDYTTQSGWLPVRMPNGQQALVPVQRLEVKPLAERTL
jgi:flagellar basal body rod protein FlgF